MNGLTNHRLFGWLGGLGRVAMLLSEAIHSLCSRKINWRDLTNQLFFIGVKSQSVVLVTGAFTGMVLCAQTYFQFHKVKMDTATLAVVSVAMGSELGPVLTALMVAGRVGAAMAAELGYHAGDGANRRIAHFGHTSGGLPRRAAVFGDGHRAAAVDDRVHCSWYRRRLFGRHGAAGMDPAYTWQTTCCVTRCRRKCGWASSRRSFSRRYSRWSVATKESTAVKGPKAWAAPPPKAVVYSSITILISNFFLTLLLSRLLKI